MENKNVHDRIPRFEDMMIPTLLALKALGGSGSNTEINEKVYEAMNFDDEVLNIPHKTEGLQSEVDHRLTRARRYMRKYGLIEDSSRGVWSIVDNTLDPHSIDPREIVRKVKSTQSSDKPDTEADNKAMSSIEENAEATAWESILLDILKNMDPSAFERLCQRLLRESGFTEVEVTGRPCDGGIDGKGVFSLNSFMNFDVIFQCKRYRDAVKSKHIRDFRGAMQGRTDKGLFITTGRFTQEAYKEASRDGVPRIVLVDGIGVCQKLKELNLGVTTKVTTNEEVTVNPEWFSKI